MEREQHIQILGWLYIIRGVLMVIGGVIALIACTFAGVFSGDLGEALITPLVGFGVALLLFVLSLPSFLAGKGLLEGKGWARVLAMVLGALNVFEIPLGTALCIYTFWVLWGQEADYHFEGRLSAAREYDRY